MKKKIKSLFEIREDIIDEINRDNIRIIDIAYEAKVATATVYNFLSRKNYNQKIIDWYLNKED